MFKLISAVVHYFVGGVCREWRISYQFHYFSRAPPYRLSATNYRI